MPSASAVRIQIEHALERRFPAALTPAPRAIRETAPTGIDEVDRLLGGGLPVGAISEVAGPESSGRTTLALSFVAGRTREGLVCAWVDAGDALDAESAAASGVNLRQLLWVRCRSESPIARGQDRAKPSSAKPWPRLDQALRATDLLLQAGGFAALVLDLGGTAPEHGLRIPLATWFRFRQALPRAVFSAGARARAACAIQRGGGFGVRAPACAGGRRDRAERLDIPGTVRARRRRSTYPVGRLRKPPAATWPATSQWQQELRA